VLPLELELAVAVAAREHDEHGERLHAPAPVVIESNKRRTWMHMVDVQTRVSKCYQAAKPQAASMSSIRKLVVCW
jgi:putative SOS response-associated peptidase YedK